MPALLERGVFDGAFGNSREGTHKGALTGRETDSAVQGVV